MIFFKIFVSGILILLTHVTKNDVAGFTTSFIIPSTAYQASFPSTDLTAPNIQTSDSIIPTTFIPTNNVQTTFIPTPFIQTTSFFNLNTPIVVYTTAPPFYAPSSTSVAPANLTSKENLSWIEIVAIILGIFAFIIIAIIIASCSFVACAAYSRKNKNEERDPRTKDDAYKRSTINKAKANQSDVKSKTEEEVSSKTVEDGDADASSISANNDASSISANRSTYRSDHQTYILP